MRRILFLDLLGKRRQRTAEDERNGYLLAAMMNRHSPRMVADLLAEAHFWHVLALTVWATVYGWTWAQAELDRMEVAPCR